MPVTGMYSKGETRLRKLLSVFSDMLFPPICVFCLCYSRDTVCADCREALITSCRQAEAGDTVYIGERLFCYAKYMGILRDRFIDYKFGKTLWLGRCFGEMMYEAFFQALCVSPPDVVTYVPVSRKRFRERGFDQSREMAAAFAKRLRVPCLALLLCRNTGGQQSGLHRNQRFAEAEGRFCIRGEKENIKGKRVLLIDDIFTTGATLNACTKLLLDAGASAVDGMAFATGRTDL